MGIIFSTACGGNFEKFILKRKGALPRAVRESRDHDTAVRVRFLAPRWGVATIELAGNEGSVAPVGHPAKQEATRMSHAPAPREQRAD